MKILFIGDLNEYGRSFQRFRALADLGNEVKGFSMVPVPFVPGIDKSIFLERLFWKLKLPIDSTGVNKKIHQAIKNEKFDIIWIEKGNTIKPKTLSFIKKISRKRSWFLFPKMICTLNTTVLFIMIWGLNIMILFLLLRFTI